MPYSNAVRQHSIPNEFFVIRRIFLAIHLTALDKQSHEFDF
jgi:hypothetical protein